MGGVRPGRVITGWLVLIGLYTVLENSDRVADALGLGNSAIRALSDPTRPLIRDHGAGSSAGSSGSSGSSSGTGRLWSGGRPIAPSTPITVPHSPWIGPPLTNPFQSQGVPPAKNGATK
jgi:hypothetical protein